MIFEYITPEWLAAIEARAQAKLGISISGSEGTATKSGITIQWVYDQEEETLTVGDTHKPWFVPEENIEEQLTKLVTETKPPDVVIPT